MSMIDHLVQRRVEGRPDLKVLGFKFARMVDNLPRCEATGHLCGTDTWEASYQCPCATCQAWLARQPKQSPINLGWFSAFP